MRAGHMHGKASYQASLASVALNKLPREDTSPGRGRSSLVLFHQRFCPRRCAQSASSSYWVSSSLLSEHDTGSGVLMTRQNYFVSRNDKKPWGIVAESLLHEGMLARPAVRELFESDLIKTRLHLRLGVATAGGAGCMSLTCGLPPTLRIYLCL